MDKQTIEGKEVRLRSAQGEISRIVVRVLENSVLICRPEEYGKAKEEGREPVAMAFKIADILT